MEELEVKASQLSLQDSARLTRDDLIQKNECLLHENKWLRAQLDSFLSERATDREIFSNVHSYEASKGAANAVLYSLFNICEQGTAKALAQWINSGVLPSRGSLRRFKGDIRQLRNNRGESLLHVAASKSNVTEANKVEIIKLLVSQLKMDVNIKDPFGHTPLHKAAISNYEHVVDVLIECGASCLTQDKAGLTPLTKALAFSRPKEGVILKLLEYSKSEREGKIQEKNAQDQSKDDAISSSHQDIQAIIQSQSLDYFKRLLVNDLRKVERFAVMVKKLQQMTSITNERQNSALLKAMDYTVWITEVINVFGTNVLSSTSFQNEVRYQTFRWGYDSDRSNGAAVIRYSWWKVLMCDIFIPAMKKLEQFTLPMKTDQITSRHIWHYVILYKAISIRIPGVLSVEEESTIIRISDVEAFMRYLPHSEHIEIAGETFVIVEYHAAESQFIIDRPYPGETQGHIMGFFTGNSRSQFPPRIATKSIAEIDPGNRHDNDQDSEIGLYQEMQFLDLENKEYEIATKVGPFPTKSEASAFSKKWRQMCLHAFMKHQCVCDAEACVKSCPQREGQMMCTNSMIQIGKELSQSHFGKRSYFNLQKSRAVIQETLKTKRPS